MKSNEIETCVTKVKQILRDNFGTRDNDIELICAFIDRFTSVDIDIEHLRKELYKVPALESITRARRKVQENPEYWGNKRKQRAKASESVKRWAVTN